MAVEMTVSTTIHIISMENGRDDSMDGDESEYKYDSGLDRIDDSRSGSIDDANGGRKTSSMSKTLVML